MNNSGAENYNINENIIINSKKKILKNNLDNQIRQEEIKCKIPNFIFEFLIRLYYFTKEIRHKIEIKYEDTNNYYPINSDYLENIKSVYKYKEISKELKNYK